MSEHVIARFGFFPMVNADRVTVMQANTSLAVATGDLDLRQAGASVIGVGGSTRISEGGAMVVAAGGDATIEKGGAVVVAARSVQVSDGFVGLAIGRSVSVRDSRVLLGTAQAAALGAALGLVVLVGKVARRR